MLSFNLRRFVLDKYFIFLDIDGVLNSIGTNILDDTYIKRLSLIQKEFNSEIILISTWCELWEINDLKAVEMRNLLTQKLKDYNMFISSFCYDSSAKRGTSIFNFLEKYKEDKVHYLILDDWIYEDYIGNMKDHQILTSFFDSKNGGIKESDIEKAINILKN